MSAEQRRRRSVLRASSRLRRDEHGATAVEFALVSPMLFMLLVGIIQFGWLLHCAVSVRWSLEASARELLINPGATADQIKQDMLDRLNGLADSSNLSVSLTSATTATGDEFQVQSTYSQAPFIPFLPRYTFNSTVTVPNLG